VDVLADDDEVSRLGDEVERLGAEIERLAAEHAVRISHLERALASRDLIGQAKGVLMATRGCSADEAFSVLTHSSQHQNRKLTEIAAQVVASVVIASPAEAAG
jgi:AmiR/NasT family two-component response regulator